MISPLRLAGAAALCAALLLSACAKKTDQTTTSTDTSTATTAPAADASASTAPGEATGTTATAAPVIAASTAPDTSATTTASSTTTTASGSSGGASGGAYITMPVYPGATDAKDTGSLSVTTNAGSVQMKSYMTKDDAKKVTDWYKSKLPASFKNTVMTVDSKTMGTFVDEHTDGDQSIIVTTTDDGSTRIQITTKHGK